MWRSMKTYMKKELLIVHVLGEKDEFWLDWAAVILCKVQTAAEDAVAYTVYAKITVQY